MKKLSSGLYVVIFILIIIGILVGFYFLGKVFKPQSNTDYNHFKFYKQGKVWYTQIQLHNQLQTIPFYNHPNDLGDIYVEKDIAAKVFRNTTDMILITLDPDGGSIPGQAGVQISRLTGSRFNIFNMPTYSALTRLDENVNVENATSIIRIANCSSANLTTSVIYIKIGSKNIIYSKDNCVILEGATAKDTLRVAERFDYELLGVMQT
jgi:hypothetical protein